MDHVELERRESAPSILDGVLLAFLVVLASLAAATSIGSKTDLALQAVLVTHRRLGLVFLVLLLFHYGRASGRFGSTVARRAGEIAEPRATALLCVCASLVLAAGRWRLWAAGAAMAGALGLLELLVPRRPSGRRGIDAAVLGTCAVLAASLDVDRAVRSVIVLLGFVILLRGAGFVWRARGVLRTGWNGGNLGLITNALALPMVLFALVVSGRGVSGQYGSNVRFISHLHQVTAWAYLIGFALHHRRQARASAAGASRRWHPAAVAALALPVLVAGISLAELGGYRPLPSRAAGARMLRPSPLSELRGYRAQGEDDWAMVATTRCSQPRCHGRVAAQHDVSAHARAFTNPQFRWELARFIADKGRAAADYCLACHAPLGVIQYPSGAYVEDPLTTNDPWFTLGVGCVVCHRAVAAPEADRLGNAALAIRPTWLEPHRYLGEEHAEGATLAGDLIFMVPALHRRTWRIEPSAADRVCAACHVVRLPVSLSADGRERIIADHVSSFLASPFGRAGYSCASCHMPRFYDVRLAYHYVDHHYLGAGSSLPYSDAAADAALRRISIGFLSGLGDVMLEASNRAAAPPCIGDLDGQSKPRSRAASDSNRFDLLRTRVSVAGEEPGLVRLSVATTNDCVGHDFPAGGGIRAYLEVEAFGEDGRRTGHYGGAEPDGSPRDLPTVLGRRAEDADGHAMKDRRFWRAVRVTFERTIAPGETVIDAVDLPLLSAEPPAWITATWRYLRPETMRELERNGRASTSPVTIGVGRWERARRVLPEAPSPAPSASAVMLPGDR